MTSIHGKYGNENRKFLSSIFKPPPSQVFMKVSQPVTLPLKCDLCQLRGNIEVYNQGRLGSCTANAIAGAYKIMSIIKYNRSVSISRLFVYYNERIIIGTVFQDRSIHKRWFPFHANSRFLSRKVLAVH